MNFKIETTTTSQEALCDLLDQQGKESLEESLCREASAKSPKAFWAFRRLGYLQLHQNKWSEAVPSLQHAIRGFPNSADLWQVCALLLFLPLLYIIFLGFALQC